MFQLLSDLAIKTTFVLFVATAISMTLRKSSAAARHRLWGLTMIGLLGMPLLPLVTPAIWSLKIPPDVAAFIPSVVPPERSTVFAPHDSGFVAHSFSVVDSPSIVREEPIDSAYVAPIEPGVVTVGPQQASSIDWTFIVSIVPLIWAGGTLLVLLNLAVGTWRVVKFKLTSSPVIDSTLQLLADQQRQRDRKSTRLNSSHG